MAGAIRAKQLFVCSSILASNSYKKLLLRFPRRSINVIAGNLGSSETKKKEKEKRKRRKEFEVAREKAEAVVNKEKRRTRSSREYEIGDCGEVPSSHVPVLIGEVVDVFSSVHLRSFVDCTLGAAGHSSSIIQSHSEMKHFVGMDVDPVARKLGHFHIDSLMHPTLKASIVLKNFKYIKSVIADTHPELLDVGVDGILMDLGMSSMQVNNPDRGFSVLQEGPLDMRMDPQATLTAEDIVNSWPESELGRVLRDYGEESNWYVLQNRIVKARLNGGLHSTGELVDLIRGMSPPSRGGRQGWIKTATRVFQGLRIAVNDELKTLQNSLYSSFDVLSPGGRLAVISFHSLEDRVVKQTFLNILGFQRVEINTEVSLKPERQIEESIVKELKEKEAWIKQTVIGSKGVILTKRPITPSEEEERLNRRARSAKLRVIQKLKTSSTSKPFFSPMGAIDLSFSQSLLLSPSRANTTYSSHRSVSFLPPGSKPRCLPPLRSMSHDDDDTASKEAKLWGGRFEESVTEKVEKFTESISFDKVLYKQDIMGSKAHATMLAHQGLIIDSDKDSILRGLDDIERQIESDKFEWRTDREDVHMNIEAALTDLIGEPAKKLHTARSRNDQVATDFRLWCRDAIDSIIVKIKNLQTAMVALALKNEALIVPGYTHLQRAQPVLLPHVLLTYVEQLERDAGRYIDCRERLNVCPLGACALAGTGLPIDRFMTASALGFTEPMRNSIDAVSDRDFVLEFLYANSNTAIHLSRLGEEWVLWASEEFGFMTPSDSVSTGSSIMPQKKNPDPMELVRGKSARVIGDLVTVLTLCKGLPLAYNRDFQEDKEPMFDSTKTIMGMIDVSAEFAQNVTFNEERINKSLPAGHLDATTLADYLVKKGMPFRSSHDVVGKLVGVCVSRGCELQNLSLGEMKKLSPVFEEDVFGYLGVENSVNKFSSYGSTGSNCVAEQLGYWVKKLNITTT